MSVLPSRRCTDREHHRKPERDGEVEVQLRSEIIIMMTAPVRSFCEQSAGKDRGADVAEEEGGRPDLRESNRRKVPFPGQLGEAARFDLVDLEARKALHLAVALLRPVIDIVV